MQVIVFADRTTGALAEVSDLEARALLPVAGKPVIEYTLESLADAGLTDVTLFVGPDAPRLRTLLGTGERWGLQLRIASSRGNESPSALLQRLGSKLKAPFIAMRGDALQGVSVTDLGSPQRPMRAHDADGWIMVEDMDQVSAALSQLDAVSDQTNAQYFDLATPVAYHAACTAVLRGQVQGATREGQPTMPGLRSGRRAQVLGHVAPSATSWVGAGARIARDASLRGTVCVEAGCLIERGADLEDCIVMPGTYVGERLCVRRAIVSPRGMLRLDDQALVPVTDPLWLAAVDPDAQLNPPTLTERLVALLALVIWAPPALLTLAGPRLFRRPPGSASLAPLLQVCAGKRLLVGGAGSLVHPEAALRRAGACSEELEVAARIVNRLPLSARLHYWLGAHLHAFRRDHAPTTNTEDALA